MAWQTKQPWRIAYTAQRRRQESGQNRLPGRLPLAGNLRRAAVHRWSCCIQRWTTRWEATGAHRQQGGRVPQRHAILSRQQTMAGTTSKERARLHDPPQPGVNSISPTPRAGDQVELPSVTADADDNTELNDMENRYSTVYLRKSFSVSGDVPRQLLLRVYSDDGAIVWINGVEIARLRVRPGEPSHTTTASPNHEAAWDDIPILDTTSISSPWGKRAGHYGTQRLTGQQRFLHRRRASHAAGIGHPTPTNTRKAKRHIHGIRAASNPRNKPHTCRTHPPATRSPSAPK